MRLIISLRLIVSERQVAKLTDFRLDKSTILKSWCRRAFQRDNERVGRLGLPPDFGVSGGAPLQSGPVAALAITIAHPGVRR